MRISANNLKHIVLAGLLALGVTVTGCRSSSTGRPATQKMADRATANRVKDALKDSKVYKFPNVDVTALSGNVQLSGFVQTEQQRQQAAEIASKVNGVNQVINGIMIQPMPTGRATIRDTTGGETGRAYVNPPQGQQQGTTQQQAPRQSQP